MTEPTIIPAGKYADVHADDAPSPHLTESKEAMAVDKNSFWSSLNIRVTVVNSIIVAIVGIVGVYTSNLITQQALAQKVQTLEMKVEERKKQRDDEMREIKTDLKNTVVTKEVLDLKLQPILNNQVEQKKAMEDLKTLIIQQRQYQPQP